MRKLVLGMLLVAGCVAVEGSLAAQDFPLRPVTDPTPIVGVPRFLKSSEVMLEGKRIVFFGIDPAMDGMPCEADGKLWDCGSAAKRILLNFVGREPLTCEPQRIDLFRRVFAKCLVHGEDLALELIRQGVAVALPEETDEYVAAEKEAKAKKAGMWRGRFETPAAFRLRMSPDPMPR